MQGSLRSLESSLEVAIRAPADADADVARRMRREAPLEFTTVMAQVTELVLVQDEEARRMARDRLAGGEADATTSGRDRA